MKTSLKNTPHPFKYWKFKNWVFLIWAFCPPSVLTAQNQPADSCRIIFKKAMDYVAQEEFEKAILKFNAVKACDPNFTAKTDSIILTVFKKINGLRQKAEGEKRKADTEKRRAKQAEEIAEKANIALQYAAKETQKALANALFEQRRADTLLGIAKAEKEKANNERQKAESGERRMINLSTYYRMKAENADPILLARIAEYMHTKYPDFDVTTRLFNETMQDTTMPAWSNQFIFEHNNQVISAIAISPDRTKFFTGDNFGLGKIWDIDGKLLESFECSYSRLCAATFTPDGKNLLTATTDNIIRLWDLQGNNLEAFDIPEGIVTAAFSPDAQKLLVSDYSGTICLHDRMTKTKLRSFFGHQSEVLALCFSPDGQYFLTGSSDSTALFYAITGELISSLTGHQGIIKAVAISPNGQYLATGSYDKTARLWNRQGKALWSFKHDGGVQALSFSNYSDRLLTGSLDKTVRRYHWADTTKQVLYGHTKGLSAVALIPYSDLAISASFDKTLRLWDFSPDLVDTTSTHLADNTQAQVHFSPDMSLYAVLSRRGELKVYSSEKQLVQTYKEEGAAAITQAVFSPDNQYILTASRDMSLKLWNLKGHVVQVFTDPNTNSKTDTVIGLFFSPDGQYILSQSRTKNQTSRRSGRQVEAKLWSRQGKRLKVFDKIEDLISGFLDDGKHFLTTGSEARIWAIHDDATQNIELSYYVTASCINTDINRTLLVGSDMVPRLFTNNGKYIRALKKLSREPLKVSLSSKGGLVAIATADSTVRIWDTLGQLVQVLPRLDTTIQALAFSDDNAELWLCTDKGKILAYKLKPIQAYSFLELDDMGIDLEPEDEVLISSEIAQRDWQNRENEKIRTAQREARRLLDEKIYAAQMEARKLMEQEQLKKEKEQREADEQELKNIVQKRKPTVSELRKALLNVIHFANIESDSAQQQSYFQLEKPIFDLYKNAKDSVQHRSRIAAQYNELAWNLILSKEFASAEKMLRHGIAIDSSHKILYTNLPPSILFQGRFEDAKAEYLRLKDLPLDVSDFATYEEAFWDDFNSFENAECIPPERMPDVEAIKALLAQKKK
jgi:WD40 repeat protein